MAQTISHFILLAIYRFVQVHKDIFGNIDFHQQILVEHKDNNLNLTNTITQLEEEKKQFHAALALKEKVLSLEKEKIVKLSEKIEILTMENEQLIQKCQRIIDDDDNYFLEDQGNEKSIMNDLKIENLELIKKCESLMATSAETASFIDSILKEKENIALESKDKEILLERERMKTQDLQNRIKILENNLEETKETLRRANEDKEKYILNQNQNMNMISTIKQKTIVPMKPKEEYSYREKGLFLKYLREEVLFEKNVNYSQFDFSTEEITHYEIFRDGFLKANNRYVYLDAKMYKLGLEDSNKSLREKADIRNHIGFDLYCL